MRKSLPGYNSESGRSLASSKSGSEIDCFKTVAFQEVIETREVDRRTPEEMETCWLSQCDYDSIRERAQKELERHLINNDTDLSRAHCSSSSRQRSLDEDVPADHAEEDDESVCIRGLDLLNDESLSFIHRTRLTAVKAVLQVQEYRLQQSSLGTSIDAQAIADVYAECSSFCKQMAHEKALEDAQEVESYLSEARKTLQRRQQQQGRKKARPNQLRVSRSAKELLLGPCKKMRLPRIFPLGRKHSI